MNVKDLHISRAVESITKGMKIGKSLIWVLIFQFTFGAALPAFTPAFAEEGRDAGDTTPSSSSSPSNGSGSGHFQPDDLASAEPAKEPAKDQLTESVRPGENYPLFADDPVARRIVDTSRDFETADPSLTKSYPKGASIDRISTQWHRTLDISTDDQGRVFSRVTNNFHLNKPDARNEPVGFTLNQLDFKYDQANKEFIIQKLVYDKRLNIRRATNEHVIKDVVITSKNKAGNPKFLIDPNYIVMATDQGIELMLVDNILQNTFNADIFMPTIAPPAPYKGWVIGDIQFLTPGTKPIKFANEDYFDRIFEHDLGVTFVGPKGEKVDYRIPRDDIKETLRKSILGALFVIHAANPNPENEGMIQEILQEEPKVIEEYTTRVKKAMEEADALGTEENVIKAAYKTLAHHSDLKKLVSLARKGGGLDSLAKSPRHVFSAKTDENSDWVKTYNYVTAGMSEEAKEKAAQNWRKIYLEKKKAEREAIAEANKNLAQRMYTRLGNKWPKILSAHNMLMASAAISGVALIKYNGAVASVMSHWLQWASSIPVLSGFTDPIHNVIPHLNNAYTVSRLILGAGMMISLFNIQAYVSKLKAKKDGRNWDSIVAMYNYGLNLVGRVFYPLKRVAWNLAGQTNIERAMAHGFHPFESARNLGLTLNRPGATQEEKDAKAQQIVKITMDDATRKARARLVAAVIAMERHNEIDITTLMMAAENLDLDKFAYIGTSPDFMRTYNLVQRTAYDALVQIIDGGAGRFDSSDEKLIAEYDAAYKKVIAEYEARKARLTVDPSASVTQRVRAYTYDKIDRSVDFVRSLRERVNSTGNRFIENEIFGSLSNYRRYRDGELDAESARVARTQDEVDYKSTIAVDAAARANQYANIATLGPGSPQIIAEAGLQRILYSCFAPLEALTSADERTLVEPHPPLSDDEFAENRQKQDTVRGALGAIVKNRFNPKEDKSIVKNLGKQQWLIWDAFQPYISLSTMAIVAGMVLQQTVNAATDSYVVGFAKAITNMPEILINAMMMQTFVLLTKRAWSWVYGFGYALVWPPTQIMMRDQEKKLTLNDEALRAADAAMEQGLRLNDRERLKEGVNAMYLLYNGQKIPQTFITLATQPERFTEEGYVTTAREFLEYRKTEGNEPVATKPNGFVYKFLLNFVLGTMGSTLLYAPFSMTPAVQAMFNPEKHPEFTYSDKFKILGVAFGFWAANLVVTNAAGKAIEGLSWIAGKTPDVVRGLGTQAMDTIRNTPGAIKEATSETVTAIRNIPQGLVRIGTAIKETLKRAQSRCVSALRPGTKLEKPEDKKPSEDKTPHKTDGDLPKASGE